MNETTKRREPAPASPERATSKFESVMWMVGNWNLTARVLTTKPGGERVRHGTSEATVLPGGRWLSFLDVNADGTNQWFLAHSGTTGKWVNVSIDDSGNAVILQSDDWRNNRLVFTAKWAEVLGERIRLRQTLERQGDAEFRVLTEQRLANGVWISLDEFNYRRR